MAILPQLITAAGGWHLGTGIKLRVSKYPAQLKRGAWEICAYLHGAKACITRVGQYDAWFQQVLILAELMAADCLGRSHRQLTCSPAAD
jgi:hypothetical protein